MTFAISILFIASAYKIARVVARPLARVVESALNY